MQRLMGLFACCAAVWLSLATPASAEVPPRGSRNCETQRSAIVYDHPAFRLGTGPRASEYLLTEVITRCNTNGQTRQYRRLGLNGGRVDYVPAVDARQLVAERYDAIAPYSQKSALVKREDGRWVNYEFERGEGGPYLPYTEVVSLFAHEQCEAGMRDNKVRSPAIAVGLAAADASGRRTAYVYYGEGEPTVIEGLGGPGITHPIERHRDLLIGRALGDDGKVMHRFYSLGGRPLSPQVGEISRWATAIDLADLDNQLKNAPVCYGALAVDLFLVGPSLDVNPDDVFWGPLLTPIGADGAPLALPEGAVGVAPMTGWRHGTMPAPARPLPNARPRYAPLPMTRVWAVIYPANDSFQFTLAEGTVAEAIQRSPGSERYRDFAAMNWHEGFDRNDPDSFFRSGRALSVQSTDGSWQARSYFREEIRGASNADLGQAIASWQSAAISAQQADLAAYEAERARENAASLAAFDATYQTCRFAPPWNLDRERIARHAIACPNNYNTEDIARLQREGYGGDVVGTVEQTYLRDMEQDQQYRAEQAENARNYVPPGSWEAALRAASDQQVRDIQTSTTNWLEARRRQYNADWQRSQRGY